MGNGYQRQSTADIVNDAVIEAGPINDEFNAIQDAFNGTTGHTHDGTSGEGPKISLTGAVSGTLGVTNGGTGLSSVAGNSMFYADGANSITSFTTTSFGRSLLNQASASATRTAIGAQTSDAGLTSISGLTTSANQLLYTTGSDTYATTSLTPFARSILDDVDAASVRATIGVSEAGTSQPLDSGLTSIAGLTTSSDKMIYTSSSDTYQTTDITPFARSILDDTSASQVRSTINASVEGHNHDINSDTTGTLLISRGGTGSTTSVGARTNLGLDIGSDVQKFDNKLESMADLTLGSNIKNQLMWITSAIAGGETRLRDVVGSVVNPAASSNAGAIIEFNPSSGFLKLDSGFVVCWIRGQATYLNTANLRYRWNFPVSFSATPVVAGVSMIYDSAISMSPSLDTLTCYASAVFSSRADILVRSDGGSFGNDDVGARDDRIDVTALAIGRFY